jgi:hypothetical protein
MLDFLRVTASSSKKTIDIFPKFVIKKSKDLMIRGGDFYAIWIEAEQRWSTDEQDAIRLIDSEVQSYFEEHKSDYGDNVHVKYLWDSSSGMIDNWHKYCQRDNYICQSESHERHVCYQKTSIFSGRRRHLCI